MGFKKEMSTGRCLKMSFHDVVVDFPTTKSCKKIQILENSLEDMQLCHLNPSKSKDNIDTKYWRQLKRLKTKPKKILPLKTKFHCLM